MVRLCIIWSPQEARNNDGASKNVQVLRCRLDGQGYDLRDFDKLVTMSDVDMPSFEVIKQPWQADLDLRIKLH